MERRFHIGPLDRLTMGDIVRALTLSAALDWYAEQADLDAEADRAIRDAARGRGRP